MDKISPEKAIKELTMLLMYLTRFNEGDRFGTSLDMAWKGYDFNTINDLDEDDFIRQGSHRSKSVALTDKGMELSRELLKKYSIADWEQYNKDAGAGYA